MYLPSFRVRRNITHILYYRYNVGNLFRAIETKRDIFELSLIKMIVERNTFQCLNNIISTRNCIYSCVFLYYIRFIYVLQKTLS